jgi:tetratricopeptide (TPR) repeat protein
MVAVWGLLNSSVTHRDGGIMIRRILPIWIASLLASSLASAENLDKCYEGWNATESGQYDAAIVLYDTCIKEGALSSDSLARTYRNIGITYRRAGKPRKAVEAYGKAIAIGPNDVVDDYINRGNALDEAGEFDRAMADYAKALQLKPGDGDVYYNRGIAYERKKLFDRAKTDFIAAYEHGLRSQQLYERFVAYGLTDRWQ